MLTSIEADGFAASDVAPIGDCKVLLAGAAWGLVVEVHLPSGNTRVVGQLPTQIHVARFGSGPPSQLLVWSQSSPTLGWLDAVTSTFRALPLPSHPWGHRTTGPAVVLTTGMIAMAPTGDARPLRSPRPWQDAPLIWVLDGDGGLLRSIGRVPDIGGDYLSAVWSQVRIGNLGDRLLVADLSDATVEILAVEDGREPGTEPSMFQLPRYFEAPPIWEDIWEAEWLLNGTHPRVYHVPHLADVAFAPDGRLFVIRNGRAAWDRSDSPLTKGLYDRPGGWTVARQWLEIYRADGELLGAYTLPDDRTHRLVVGMDYLFLWRADGSISVIRDPTATPACGIHEPVIEIPYFDSPDATPRLTRIPESSS